MKRKKSQGGWGGGQGKCERRSKAFVKIQKNFFFLGGGGGGGVRVRSEAFVKIQKTKKNWGGGGAWVGGSGWM